MPVEVIELKPVRVLEAITAVGSLRSNESVVLRPEVAGRIAAIGFRDGQSVRRGQLLVGLDATLNEAEVVGEQFALGVQLSVTCVRDPSGAITGYLGIAIDITERQKAEKELRQREVILDAVAASAGLLLKASDWKVIINEILEKLGWTINASHAYLFEAHPGPEGDTLLSIRYEWSASSFVSDLDNSLYHNMPFHEPGLERWHELVIQQNKPFVGDRVKSSALEMEILQ